MKKYTRGFTLIEMMAVVTIIGILSTIVYANFSESYKVARDAERQADLRNMQNALELYKLKNGHYPERCDVTGENWSGQLDTDYECDDGSNQYIVGLAPEFIPVLPTDQKLNGFNSGYVYTTNTDGTVYKLMAKKTVENEEVDYNHEFKSCDANSAGTGLCDTPLTPSHCQETAVQFQKSYGLWGGFATGDDETEVLDNTKDVICDIE